MIRQLFQKHKEVILYLFFGGLTFLVSIGSFAFFHVAAGVNELAANVISWILAVFFAYVTNRTWVFDGRTQTAGAFLRQMASFFGGRLLTLLIEEAVIFIFITKLGYNSMIVKIAAQVIVIVLNYVISKLWVFRKKDGDVTPES